LFLQNRGEKRGADSVHVEALLEVGNREGEREGKEQRQGKNFHYTRALKRLRENRKVNQIMQTRAGPENLSGGVWGPKIDGCWMGRKAFCRRGTKVKKQIKERHVRTTSGGKDRPLKVGKSRGSSCCRWDRGLKQSKKKNRVRKREINKGARRKVRSRAGVNGE